MIDDETRKALETHIAVQLAVLPRRHFRAIGAPHGGDDSRAEVARALVDSMAFPFTITRSGDKAEALKIPAPTDGRKSWADKL